jgi:hypothetical protein
MRQINVKKVNKDKDNKEQKMKQNCAVNAPENRAIIQK